MGLSEWSGRSVFWVPLKLAKMLGFEGIYSFPLALPLDQNENWDSPYSHVNTQN